MPGIEPGSAMCKADALTRCAVALAHKRTDFGFGGSGLGTTSSGAQELLLSLCSEIIPGRLMGLYGMPEIKPRSAPCKANALIAVQIYLSSP